jgi:UDP-N-acetylmuramoyl-tripeptide--D-alanyl-D-alanine ligase
MTTPMMTLAQAHAMLPGSVLVGDPATSFCRVHSDTRSLQAGDLFVALKGERFDAHNFLPQVQASGAVAALAERGLAEAGLSGLLVPNALTALGQLSTAWRQRFTLPLIAVTGSNGKTTVTQMIASILQAWHGAGAFATQGNFNNDIGVPLTLLRLRQDGIDQAGGAHHLAGVVELGMNHPGEIAGLARMAAPTVALINNAQREHLEFMSTVEAVARENGTVIEALGASGVAVFPADDAYASLWHDMAGLRPVLTFALQAPADVTADATWVVDHWDMSLHLPSGGIALRLHVAGLHNVKNAAAAAACALAAGCPHSAIAQGLEAFQAVKGRSQWKALERRGVAVSLIDDSYNANPDSVRAAIDVLAALPAPRWLVLGDMGEVGDQGPAFHAEIGAYAQARGIEQFWCVGDLCAHAANAYLGARHFASIDYMLNTPEPEFNAVLVKGSRFMKMERMVAQLLQQEGTHAA